MKIKQYQDGGITYLPTVNNRSGAVSGGAASSDDGGDSKVPGFAKELISIIKEKGLDNDVEKFLSQIEMILNSAHDPTGEHISMREILRATRLASAVNVNYEAFGDAKKNLEEEGAFGEIATTQNGEIYVLNTENNNFETVAPKDYDENIHKVLTNGDVLKIRQKYPQFAFNTTMLEDVDSAIGMATVTTRLYTLIEKFKPTKITGYSLKQQNKIQEGFQHIVAGDVGDTKGVIAAGADGIYKIEQSSTIADTGVEEALHYLWNALDKDYKKTLTAKAAVEGFDIDALLFTMLYSGTERSVVPDYDKDASEEYAAAHGGASGSTSWDEDDYLVRISSGDWGPSKNVAIVAKGKTPTDNARMIVKGWDTGPIIGHDRSTLPISTLRQIISNAWGLQAANTSSITYGNSRVGTEELDALIWDGTSHLEIAQLPYTHDEQGKIVPNFQALEKMDKLNQYISTHPGATELEINEYINSKFDDPTKLSKDKESGKYFYLEQETIPFVTFVAYSNDKTLKFSDEEKLYLEDVDRKVGRKIKDTYDNMVHYGKPYPEKGDVRSNPHLKDGKSGKFYMGNVYIPIESPWSGFNTSTVDQNYPKQTFTNVGPKMDVRSGVVEASKNPVDLTLNFNK